MNDDAIGHDQIDEETFTCEISDEVLEAAAAVAVDGRATIGCPTPSVGWSCPHGPAH